MKQTNSVKIVELLALSGKSPHCQRQEIAAEGESETEADEMAAWMAEAYYKRDAGPVRFTGFTVSECAPPVGCH